MNFYTLLEQVRTEVNDFTTLTATKIGSWINDGIQAICTRRSWDFLIVNKSDETSLVDTDMPLLFSVLEKDGAAVPAKHVTNIFDVTNGTRERIVKINYEDLDMSEYNYEVDQTPLYWYMDRNKSGAKQIQFFPKLTTSPRKFIFSYTKLVSAASGADILIIPDEYIHVLNNYVEWRSNKFNSDDRAQEAFDAYMSGMNDMIRDCATVLHDGTGRCIDRFSNGVDIP